MAVKVTNDTAGPNGLVLTLLVFNAYPQISKLNLPAPSTIQQAAAIKKVTKEIVRIRAKK